MTKDKNYDELITHLKTELYQRQRKNSSYSLRSFARDLGVSKTTISSILNQTRTPSRSTLIRIIDSLPHLAEHIEKHLTNFHIMRRISPFSFDPISDWYYLAIFHLADFPDNQASPKWISQKLNISLDLARQSLRKLIELNYIQVSLEDQMIRTSKPIKITAPLGSDGVKKHHKQKLTQAMKAIDTLSPTQREYVSLTIPTDSKQLKEMKEMISDFIGELQVRFGNETPNEIYNISVQLFPLRGSYV